MADITLAEMREDCNWREAFAYGCDFDEIAEVIAADEGMNDGDDWLAIVRLTDGRFGFLAAWCDYTGWDCRAGGRWEEADTLDGLVWAHMSGEERVRLGYPETRVGAPRG